MVTQPEEPSFARAAQADVLLEARGLGRRDPVADRWLLRDANVRLSAGERLAVWGPSGAGKTLLLRAMALLDPLDVGEVFWKGRRVTGDDVPAYRSAVVYMHQRAVLAEPTVEAALRRPFELRVHRLKTYDRDKAVALLASLGRDATFLEKTAKELSGGEMQIASLIRAVQFEPAVLLMDEPTAALDPASAEIVSQWIVRWVDEAPLKRAVALVSHDAVRNDRVGTRSIRVDAGRVEA
jgi:putative ABC transport system ATP-binding protein